VLKAEMYSEISMKFLDGGARDNACSYADRRARDGRGGRRQEGEAEGAPFGRGRDLSLCIPFRRRSLFYILREEAYRRPPLAIFPGTAKRNGRQFADGARTRACAVTLTSLLQFNAFHRKACLRRTRRAREQ